MGIHEEQPQKSAESLYVGKRKLLETRDNVDRILSAHQYFWRLVIGASLFGAATAIVFIATLADEVTGTVPPTLLWALGAFIVALATSCIGSLVTQNNVLHAIGGITSETGLDEVKERLGALEKAYRLQNTYLLIISASFFYGAIRETIYLFSLTH